MFFLVATALLTLVSVYVGARLVPPLALGPMGFAAALLVLAVPPLLAAAGVVARSLAAPALARRLTGAGALSLGWVSSLLVLTLLRELVLGAGHALLPSADLAPLRQLSAVAVPALALLATLVGLLRALGSP
jgi:uncharacterized protein